MRKRNRILLIIICILSVCVMAGLVAFAFDIQMRMDLKNRQAQTENQTESMADRDNSSTLPSTPAGSEQDNDSDDSYTAVDANIAEGSNEAKQESPVQDTADSTDPDSIGTPIPEEPSAAGPLVLAFAGDVNLDENSNPVKKYDSEKKDISKCLSEDLLKEMRDADIMMLNNEFAFSTRGEKTPNKSYTFRANPNRVEILKEMGVDIVSLANNHALDYGRDALLDTFITLDEAGIDYVGAGKDIERAKAPIYYTINGKRIAYVAASRVIFAGSWYATEDRPGMVGTYDPALICEVIREAKAESDYVIIYVHWGVERTNYPEKYQRNLAQVYIDAGADAVIGCHPHVMQGFEFYKGKLIAYSLSNFWFSRATVESALLKLIIDSDGNIKPQLIPVMAKNNYTYLITDDKERDKYFNFIKKISFDVEIDDDGILTPKTVDSSAAE